MQRCRPFQQVFAPGSDLCGHRLGEHRLDMLECCRRGMTSTTVGPGNQTWLLSAGCLAGPREIANVSNSFTKLTG